MAGPDPDALAARYDDLYRKSERVAITADRFERAVERGDDGTWGVGALVIVDGHGLFVREGDTWLLPGGHLEGDESPEAGAVREVREETGVDVETTGLAAIAEQTFVHEESGDAYEFYFATFLAEPVGDPTPAATEDRIDEAAWLSEVPENTFDRGLVAQLFETYI